MPFLRCCRVGCMQVSNLALAARPADVPPARTAAASRCRTQARGHCSIRSPRWGSIRYSVGPAEPDAPGVRRRPPRGRSHPPCPGPPRAGRRSCGGGLCPLDRQARRRAGDLRARREQRTITPGCWTRSAIPFRCCASAAGVATGFTIGTDAFQECDALGLSRPVTKWNAQIRQRGPGRQPWCAKAFTESQPKKAGRVRVLLDSRGRPAATCNFCAGRARPTGRLESRRKPAAARPAARRGATADRMRAVRSSTVAAG